MDKTSMDESFIMSEINTPIKYCAHCCSKSIDYSSLHFEFKYRYQIATTIQMSNNYYN